MKRTPQLYRDTAPTAEAVMLSIYRDMSSERKVGLVEGAIVAGRQLAMAGLRARHPGEPIDRLRRRLLGLVLGEELAERLYGPLTRHDARVS